MKARKAVAGLSLALTSGLLSACADEVPQPQPAPEPETPPAALDDQRLGRILDEIGQSVARADEAGDAGELGRRVIGPAQETREAEYAVAEATDGETGPSTLITDPQVSAVAASEDWPRPAMVVTEVPDGENLPLLLGLTQTSPRTPYALWGWVTLFPGIEVPQMARTEAGSPVVAPDAGGLAVAPENVADQYAQVLADPDSDRAEQFADDPNAQAWQETVSALEEDIGEFGEVSTDAAGTDTDPLALATADGGAIVLTEMRWDLTVSKTVEDAGLTVGWPFDVLLDDPEVDGSVTATFERTVAFSVPSADAEDSTVRPLGVTEVLVDASRDDG